ncbi:unnamed protein product [Sympodiomycopsis kandeliae]
MFQRLLVALLTAVTLVHAQALTLDTPTSLVQCLPTAITWHNAQPPVIIAAYPKGNVAAAPYFTLPTQSAGSGSYTWTVNLPAGVVTTLGLRDATGMTQNAAPVTIQSSSAAGQCQLEKVPDSAYDSGAAPSTPSSGGSGGGSSGSSGTSSGTSNTTSTNTTSSATTAKTPTTNTTSSSVPTGGTTPSVTNTNHTTTSTAHNDNAASANLDISAFFGISIATALTAAVVGGVALV